MTLVRSNGDDEDFLRLVHVQNVVLEHSKDSFSDVPRKRRATFGVLTNVTNRRLDVGDKPVSKPVGLLVKVRDLF